MSDGLQSERLLQEADVTPRALASLALVLGSLPSLAAAQSSDPADRYRTVVHARPRRDRNPAIVITARELAERGIDNLSQALDLIPQLAVRQGGRGPTMVDMRGQKQRAILVLVDGAPMDEPYYGAFDLSSIPVTDIVEIRVTLQPASPLEGPGGDGGIIEVITLRATGGRRVDGRARVGSQPDLQAAMSARAPLSQRLGLAARASAGGRIGAEDFRLTLPNGTQGVISDPQVQGHGALRIEHESRYTLTTVDGWMSHRSYWSPPTEDIPASIIFIEGETDARLVAGAQYVRRRLRLAAGLYSQWISTRSDFFSNGLSLATPYDFEQLDANRTGSALYYDQGLGKSWQLSARGSIDTESATVKRMVAMMGKPVSGRSTRAELAVGAVWKWRQLAVDGSLGVAAPLGNSAPPWPEAKLMITYAPVRALQLRATGARKGRVPTLRELYDPATGNPRLDPEQSWFAELALQLKPHELFAARVSGYYRYTDGLIRLDVPTRSHQVNYDHVRYYGLESSIELAPSKPLSGGATYIFEEAASPTLGFDAVNNFPRHKLDAWLSARLRNQLGGLLRLRYVGERVDSGVKLAPYALVDLSGWVRLSRQLRATVYLQNVADQRFQMRAGVSSLGRVVSLSVEGTWE